MGKVEDLRAIKDARFAAAQKPESQKSAPVKPVTQQAGSTLTPPLSRPVVRPAITTPDAAANESLCGHRAIGGKTCIRPRGHDEASHKYAKS